MNDRDMSLYLFYPRILFSSRKGTNTMQIEKRKKPSNPIGLKVTVNVSEKVLSTLVGMALPDLWLKRYTKAQNFIG